MIVTTRPGRRKRKAKTAQPVEIAVPRVVQATPKGRAWRLKELEPDAHQAGNDRSSPPGGV
jgi:hypothetical protein